MTRLRTKGNSAGIRPVAIGPRGKFGSELPTNMLDAVVDRAVGRRFGIVRGCEELAWCGQDALHIFVARAAKRLATRDFHSLADGTGVSLSRTRARQVAVVEALERYCWMIAPEPARLVRAAFGDVCDVSVAPMEFHRFSPRQRRRWPELGRLNDNEVIDWCWTWSVGSGEAILIPAAHVYSALGTEEPNDYLPESMSTGCASHLVTEEAILSGMCEVMERDAVAIAWHAHLPFTSLDSTDSAFGEEQDTIARRLDMQFRLFAVPSSWPFPVLIAVGRKTSGFPYAVVGAACRLDPAAAARKALYEACQVAAWLSVTQSEWSGRLNSLPDRARFYASKRGAELLEQVLSRSHGPCRLADLSPGSATSTLELAQEVEQTSGLQTLVTDITTPDVADLGLRTVRVTIPGAVDIAGDARFSQMGAERVITALNKKRASGAERVSRIGFLPAPLA